MTKLRFRAIRASDNTAVAELIRTVMTEFGCVGEGFAFVDPEVDNMSAAYPGGTARFYVVEDEAGIAGCGGFAPLAGAPAADRVVELRKMYFLARLRGSGTGSRFLQFLLDGMQEAGFASAYLETTPQMEAARHLYAKYGFSPLSAPMGDTGHSGCHVFFHRSLSQERRGEDLGE